MASNCLTRKASWLEWGCLVIIIIVLFGILTPNINIPKAKAKEAECKANLHHIQVAVERFAVDTEGTYPAYLIGGEPYRGDEHADPVNQTASDVLLRDGYTTAYPGNPFVRQKQGAKLLELQQNLQSSFVGVDPLTPGGDGEDLGFRFGIFGTTMGQVLCDVRSEYWSYDNPVTGETEQLNTWATIEYRMWDQWEGNRPALGDNYLEGQFFYKSNGPVIARQSEDGSTEPALPDGAVVVMPTERDTYIMGVYGSSRTKGKDIFGSINPVEPYGTDQPSLMNQLQFLRSEYAEDGTEGCPYSFDPNSADDSPRIAYGNPNGTRDGVVLVLTAGERY